MSITMMMAVYFAHVFRRCDVPVCVCLFLQVNVRMIRDFYFTYLTIYFVLYGHDIVCFFQSSKPYISLIHNFCS